MDTEALVAIIRAIVMKLPHVPPDVSVNPGEVTHPQPLASIQYHFSHPRIRGISGFHQYYGVRNSRLDPIRALKDRYKDRFPFPAVTPADDPAIGKLTAMRLIVGLNGGCVALLHAYGEQHLPPAILQSGSEIRLEQRILDVHTDFPRIHEMGKDSAHILVLCPVLIPGGALDVRNSGPVQLIRLGPDFLTNTAESGLVSRRNS